MLTPSQNEWIEGRRDTSPGLPARSDTMSAAATFHVHLPDYLERIGLGDAVSPDLPTLRRIVAAHTRTIAFESLDPFTRREVRLDPDGLTTKLVHGRRGGWCFEQNLLLRGALDALGYATTGLSARVLWNRPADAPPGPRNHMVLRVDLAEGPHLVDVGFGGTTPTGVLALEPETEQDTPHEPFRLVPAGSGYVLQALIAGDWQSQYWFDLTEHLFADYEVANWYLGHHPDSMFLSGLLAARPDTDRRYALSGPNLAVHHLGGPTERHLLATPADIRRALEELFLLDTSGLADLEKALARLY
jgi:arylamine N-acetyltransferase